MKKKTKAKKKPIIAPLEDPQWATNTYTVRFGGVDLRTDSDRIADLEAKVAKLDESKADKPVYEKGAFRLVRETEYGFDYSIERFDGARWSYVRFADFQWTARRWIRKHYGSTAVILDGVHHA